MGAGGGVMQSEKPLAIQAQMADTPAGKCALAGGATDDESACRIRFRVQDAMPLRIGGSRRRPYCHDGGETRGGTGTGFVVSPRGHVLTNHHVAGNCGSLEVDQLPATLVASDRDFDLALLAVEGAANWKSAVFADKPARLNSDVTVVGYPLTGLPGGLNVTRGTVSSLKGFEPVESVDHQEMRPEELAEHVQGYTRLITCTP